MEVIGNMATLPTLATSGALPKSGPFPPPALPGFLGTTSLSATPHGPARPSRASGWETRLPPLGFPVLRGPSLCRHAVAITPVATREGMKSFPRITSRLRPSPSLCWVGCHIECFEACSAFTHVTACLLAGSLKRPFPSKASTVSLPPLPLRLLPAGTTSCRVGIAPTERSRLGTAHKGDIHHSEMRKGPFCLFSSGSRFCAYALNFCLQCARFALRCHVTICFVVNSQADGPFAVR